MTQSITYTDIVKLTEGVHGATSTALGKRIGASFKRTVADYVHGDESGLIVNAYILDDGECSLFVFKSIIGMSSNESTLVTSNQYAVLMGNRLQYYELMSNLPVDGLPDIPSDVSPTVWVMDLMSSIMGYDLMAVDVV